MRVDLHKFRGVLRGAGAEPVQRRANSSYSCAGVVVVVFAARVQLAVDQLPVIALLAFRSSPAGRRGRSPPPAMERSRQKVTLMTRCRSPSRDFVHMLLERISKNECSQPSSPSEPKMTAGRLRTRSAPFSELMTLWSSNTFLGIDGLTFPFRTAFLFTACKSRPSYTPSTACGRQAARRALRPASSSRRGTPCPPDRRCIFPESRRPRPRP